MSIASAQRSIAPVCAQKQNSYFFSASRRVVDNIEIPTSVNNGLPKLKESSGRSFSDTNTKKTKRGPLQLLDEPSDVEKRAPLSFGGRRSELPPASISGGMSYSSKESGCL